MMVDEYVAAFLQRAAGEYVSVDISEVEARIIGARLTTITVNPFSPPSSSHRRTARDRSGTL